ncbi:MAG: flavodoxin family protein [Coprothermobacterota bacterium]|nr:flavodoxin family protein [Coprothermobacterota bacterium]
MNGKRIIILKGSPRGGSNSSILADQVAAGAKEAGAEVELFSLSKMEIYPCRACEACHASADSQCVIQDDMQGLFPKLREADGIVIASPIYWFTFNAQTKACIDRWYSLESPQGNALAGKQLALVLAYADTDPYSSGAVNAIRAFGDMARYLKATVAGIVYGSSGEAGAIQQQPKALAKAYELGQKLAK